MLRFVSLSLLAGFVVFSAQAQDVVIDWSVSASNGLLKYPGRVDPPITLDLQVRNINDFLYTYSGQVKVDTTGNVNIDASTLSQMSVFTASEKKVDPCKPYTDAEARLKTGLDGDFTPKKGTDGTYPSVALAASQKAWNGLKPDFVLMEAADTTSKACTAWTDYDKNLRSRLQALAHADAGTHQYEFQRTLSDNGQVTVTITETYAGAPTSGGSRDYVFSAQSNNFFISVGYLITEAQARAYDAVDIGVIKGTPAIPAANGQPAVAAVADQTIKQLRIQGAGRFRPAGAVLLNYKLPFDKVMGPKWGVALSAGPVYRVGQSSGSSTATNFGVFAGASIHLWERFWITPGFHVAEFSDLPLGFSAAGGLRIPDGYPTSFTGVNRWTTRFGIGITFKSADFKSASALVANTPAPAKPATPAAGAAPGGDTPATVPAANTPAAATPAATPTVASITADLDAANKAVQAASAAKTTADAAVKTKQTALDTANTALATANTAVTAAREKLSAAAAADRDAAAKDLATAENTLADAGTKVGAAQSDLQTAKDAAATASKTLVSDIGKVATLSKQLSDLQSAK